MKERLPFALWCRERVSTAVLRQLLLLLPRSQVWIWWSNVLCIVMDTNPFNAFLIIHQQMFCKRNLAVSLMQSWISKYSLYFLDPTKKIYFPYESFHNIFLLFPVSSWMLYRYFVIIAFYPVLFFKTCSKPCQKGWKKVR